MISFAITDRSLRIIIFSSRLSCENEGEKRESKERDEERERERERVQTDGPPREIASPGWEALLPTFLPGQPSRNIYEPAN